jgi:hypothetical protein
MLPHPSGVSAMWMKPLLASFALTAASAAGASTPIWIQGHATGTQAFWSCSPAPVPCGPVTTPTERNFFYDLGLLDLSSGSADFQTGDYRSIGLIGGTVLDLGGNQFTGINFAFTQVSGSPTACGVEPCQFTVTNLSAPTFSAMLAGVPEPETWLLFLVGFSAIGHALRIDRGQPRLKRTSC